MSNRGVTLTNAEADPRASRASQQIGAANVLPGGLSLGQVSDGALAGNLDARWAVKILAVGFAGGEVDVPHKLGRVPTLIACWMQEGAGFAYVRATSRDKWTASSVRATVGLAAGSLDNLRLVFLIGG